MSLSPSVATHCPETVAEHLPQRGGEDPGMDLLELMCPQVEVRPFWHTGTLLVGVELGKPPLPTVRRDSNTQMSTLAVFRMALRAQGEACLDPGQGFQFINWPSDSVNIRHNV